MAVSVPSGSLEHVLRIREWTPIEPGDVEVNYYAAGVGLVLEVEGDDRLELVSVTTD
ncbi:MAG: hypothetical protein JSW46_10905 [Gemmatimonadota bacterium]|nr:MAG: hypothetical protein JSW46_10905 [Gemmatimonadota bacterium]